MSQMSSFRQRIADSFIHVLDEKNLQWRAGWSRAESFPVNAFTGKKYKGINKFWLYLLALSRTENGADPDNRWATFKQIQKKGWRLKKGAVGAKVEYWQPYDFNTKQPIEWIEFYERRAEEGVNLIAKYFTVFNGRDIIGIPPLIISSGMQIEIRNGGSEAYYSIKDDIVHLPERAAFLNSYEYNSTALHELSHATGAEKRLNRNIKNLFGSKNYAYEELVAEISACFMGEHLELAETEQHIENHKAYVQSWIQSIKENPNVLIQAIKDAGDAANYLEYHAGILTRDEYLSTITESLSVSDQKIVEEQKPAQDSIPDSRSKELKKNGYVLTETLSKQLNELDRVTGKTHSLRDIHTAFQNNEYQENLKAEKLLNGIVKDLQNQELMRNKVPVP